MFFNKTNKIALFIAVALGYGGLVDVYAQDSFFNTWFNIDNFDKDSKARQQQARALWSIPHARAARMALMEEQHRRVEKLATFLMRPNDKGEKMAPMTAYEQAWNMVYSAARRDAKRAMSSEAVREMLENPDGVDEAAWLESMTPELVHGLIYALEEQYDGFDCRDDGCDARRAYLLTRALEKEGWTKGMDENEFTAALQEETLKQAAYLMAEGVDPSDAFKIACTQVHATSQISSSFRTTGPIVWSGPGNVADLSDLDPEYVKQMTEAAKKIVAAAKALQEKQHGTQTNGQSLATHASAAPAAVSAPVAPHAVSGGGAGGAGASGGGSAGGSSAASSVDYSAIFRVLAAAADGTRDAAPGGDVTWKGNTSVLTDGVSATFDKTAGNNKLEVALTDVWRPYEIIVNDDGVTMQPRADNNKSAWIYGYIFNGSGSIGDYIDEHGNLHSTSVTKTGGNILVLANGGNTFSGGVDVQQGIVYVADQGALGTGDVTLHNGTSLWVNYTWNRDFGSSFRNPVVDNGINLASGASATISYGAYPYQKVLGNDSSRIWRNMYLEGGIGGAENTHLKLEGYVSLWGGSNFDMARKHLGGNASMRNQLWYAGFTLNRSEADADAERFQGTMTLGNRVNTSKDVNNDGLQARETGAVKLVLSDDVLEYATLDATREYAWWSKETEANLAAQNELLLAGTVGGKTPSAAYTMSVSDAVRKAYAAAGGKDTNYGSFGLHQTNSNTIHISDNTKIGELKADFLGVTQASYRDAVDWSEALEAQAVRVVTLEETATLTLGKQGSTGASLFSGSVGLENMLCDMDGDGKDDLDANNVSGTSTTPTTKAGISLVKVGDNTQYIHTAKLHNLDVQGGTLGFNNVQLVNNLTLAGGSRLQLGVQNEQWKETGTINLQVGDNSGSSHRLAVVTSAVDERIKAAGTPLSARVEGSLVLNEHTEVAFDVNAMGQDSGERGSIIPVWTLETDDIKSQTEYLSSHALLQVTAATQRTDADKGGILTLNNHSPISISGVNFLKEDYTDKVYYLAAADEINVNKGGVKGSASDFDARVITLGYGFYGLISTIDGHGYYAGDNYITYDKDNAHYLGQDYIVMRVAADPTRSWTGAGISGHTTAANIWKATGLHYKDYLEGIGTERDAQWKENRAYTDGVSVKFGNLWMPTAWEQYLAEHPGTTVENFHELLTSNMVTKVGDTLFSNAPINEELTTRTANGTEVTFGGMTYGKDGSSYDIARTEGLSNHYEKVVIEGTVRPGYVTVNSDFNLKQSDGTYVTVKDDTNYVFTGTGSIADATTEQMNEIYGELLDSSDASVLDDWKTGLAKGGTGTLVIQTENSYSGGSLLHGGLTVMQNQWALGKNGSVGGAVEMAYGAGLMVDYMGANQGFADATPTGALTNSLLITHMADFDNTGATGDAQLFNRADAVTLVARLSSYDDAILTLRGASYSKEDAIAAFGSECHTYAAYIFQDPVEAYGTIRMAGYLHGEDGRLVEPSGKSYVHTGGKVQLSVVGHSVKDDNIRWKNTTLDLSLNGGAANVVALGTNFENGQPNTAGLKHYITLGTVKDNGDVYDDSGAIRAAIVSDATAKSLVNNNPASKYLVDLTLNPTTDAIFHGNLGFGMVQDAAGYAAPSRGYISLTKMGAAHQTLGNARLYDLNVQGSGLLHVAGSLSVHSVTTAAAGAQHIHVGAVEDAAANSTLTVGKDGVLSFDTTLNAADPLYKLQAAESDTKYGSELSYVLLKDGATVTGSGNWYTGKGISVAGGAAVTLNTHDYNMDETVTSTMDTTYATDAKLQAAFDDSHIFWLKNGLSGAGVTVNIVNEQMSAGATEKERGTATANGYILTHDLNAYLSASKKVYYGLQDGSTVNIGAKTILQSYQTATTNSGIEYNIAGENAALQFLDENSDKLNLTDKDNGGVQGETSYVDKATISEGGRIILGGAAAATTSTNQNTDNVINKTDITADADVVISNKAGQTASVENMKVDTVTANGYETTLSAADGKRATVTNGVMTVKQESAANNTRVQKTDVVNTLVELQKNCTVTMEDVLVDVDSKIQGVGAATEGLCDIGVGATAVPLYKTVTDEKTVVQSTLSNGEVKNLGKGSIYQATIDQMAQTDVGGTGLTLGMTLETLQNAYNSGCKFIAVQVTGSGQFLYESAGVLNAVTITGYDGTTTFKGTDVNPGLDPNFVVKVVSSEYVAQVLGVEKSEVSKTLLYIEIPEPATALLSLFALAGMAARRRRK